MAKKINIEQKLKSLLERAINEHCDFPCFGGIELDKGNDWVCVQSSRWMDGKYFVNSGNTTLSKHIDKVLRDDYENTFNRLKKSYPNKNDEEIAEMIEDMDKSESSAVYFTIKLHYFTDEKKGLAELVVEESNFYSDVINEKDSVYEKWFDGLNEKEIEKALEDVCAEYDGINFSIKGNNKTNMSMKDKKGAYEFKNSNLRFHGMKMDINGNPCFVLSTPNQRAFSVQQPYSITIHWSTKNGNSKESGVEIVEKNTKGNPFNSAEEFESYVLDLAKGRKHVKVYGNNFACGKGNFDLYSAKNSSFGRNYKLSPKDTNVWQDKEIMIQNVKNIHDLMVWRFDDDNKDKCVRFEKEDGKGDTEYVLSQEYFWEKVDGYQFGYDKVKDKFYIEKDGNKLFDVALNHGRYQFVPKSQSIYEEHFDKVRRNFTKWAKTARWERLVLPKRKDVVELIKKICIQQNFSIIDDTKNVLRAGGKLAGNVVKDTLYNGGILMF